MSFIKHSPFFLNDITAPPAWTQRADLLGQSHLLGENGHTAQISVDVPHLPAEELTVALWGNKIIVSGQHEESGHVQKFERHFLVDDAVDASQIKANLHEGVLTLTVQRQSKLEPQRIPIAQEPPDQLVSEEEEEKSSLI
mmetsp:Transcript_20469/g.33943  ORF Transcript_20469/g.33943 Transcript_20469/m.33943 type:complete len:140 (+) Transcript_20469:530-949(+)